jgi:hypothetical protein
MEVLPTSVMVRSLPLEEVQGLYGGKIMGNTCVCCGAEIPEGRQVCPRCERVKVMVSEKLISQISTIQRALGMIEGVSYGLTDSAGTALADAVQMIDETTKEMLEDG